MRNTALRIVVIEERINIEIMLLTTHIRQRRRMNRIFRTAPDEEIAKLVRYIVHVRAYRHIFAFIYRMMVRQITTQTHTVVKTLLTITLILESADSHGHIEIAYSSRMRCLRSVIQRQPRARVRVILIVIIDSNITAHLRLRLQTWTLRTNIDYTVQG